MEKLDDYSLLHIFENLPIIDRVRIERVCKRWQNLSRKSWVRFTRLDLQITTWGSLSVSKIGFNKVLNITGRYLTIIDFSKGKRNLKLKEGIISFNVGPEEVRNVCSLCPNMQELYLPERNGNYTIAPYRAPELCENFEEHHRKITPYLIPHGDTLTRLVLNMSYYKDDDKDIAFMLSKMKKLKSFDLRYFEAFSSFVNDFSNNFILNLPYDTIEELKFSFIDLHINPKVMNSVIAKCTKLHTLAIILYINDSDLSMIIAALRSSLKHLKLNLSFTKDPDKKLLSHMENLIHLETLNLGSNHCLVDDTFLKTIAENCKQIKELNISNCNAVTDDGIANISALTKLRYLDMSHLWKVKCPPLERMQNLEILYCESCRKLQNKCVYDLILRAPHLQILDLYDCPLIIEKLLNAAIEAVKLRKSNTVLNIGLARTPINLEKVRSLKKFQNINLNLTEDIRSLDYKCHEQVSSNYFYQIIL